MSVTLVYIYKIINVFQFQHALQIHLGIKINYNAPAVFKANILLIKFVRLVVQTKYGMINNVSVNKAYSEFQEPVVPVI